MLSSRACQKADSEWIRYQGITGINPDKQPAHLDMSTFLSTKTELIKNVFLMGINKLCDGISVDKKS